MTSENLFPAAHLTHEQLCDLVLALAPNPRSSDYAAIEQHLHVCPVCSSELNHLNRSLSLFREASTAHAHHALVEARTCPAQPARRTLRAPVAWLSAAAAAVALAAIVPFAFNHTAPTSSTNERPVSSAVIHNTSQGSLQAQSDEAFLDEVDDDISSTIPAAMQPLADPTAGRPSHSASTPKQN